jgi:hypothetical protein
MNFYKKAQLGVKKIQENEKISWFGETHSTHLYTPSPRSRCDATMLGF